MGSEAQEAVLASFRKFDADSSGAISREELSEVLKAPDLDGDLDGVESRLWLPGSMESIISEVR